MKSEIYIIKDDQLTPNYVGHEWETTNPNAVLYHHDDKYSALEEENDRLRDSLLKITKIQNSSPVKVYQEMESVAREALEGGE